MKVVILCRILWTAGTQKIAIMEAKTFQNMGYDVELIFIREGVKNSYNELLKDLNYKILYTKNPSKLAPFYSYITGIFMPDRKGIGDVDYNLIKGFWKQIRNAKPDVLICHDQWAGLAGYYSMKHLNVRYVVYIHERIQEIYWVNGVIKNQLKKLANTLELKILRNAELVLAVTPKVAKTIKENRGVDAIPDLPGLEIAEISEPERKNFIVTISNWSTVKFPYMYLDFMKCFPYEKLFMLGHWVDNDFKLQFIERVKSMGLENQVIVIGDINEKEKNDYLSQAKCLLRFGNEEFGPGMGTMEAIEHLLPVIVNDGIGISDIIETNNLGCVIKNNNYSDAKSFLDNINNKDFYKNIQNNIIKVINNNSWENHVIKILKNLKTFEYS